MSGRGFLRRAIDALDAYVPGIQPEGSGWLKLNTNENPFPPSPRVLAAVRDAVDERLALYPNPRAEPVRVAAAKAFGVTDDMVVVGNGADEALAMITRAVLDKGDRVVIGDPTYTLVEVLVAVQAARLTRVRLDPDFSLPERFFTKAAEQSVQLVYLPNPNAPTGVLHPLDEIDRLCETTDGVVVLDEAYVEFAPEHGLGLVHKYANLIVLRSLSKSYSLAGVRVGFAIAQPELIAGLLKVKDSYNVDTLSQVAAVAALEDGAYAAECVGRVIEQREVLSAALGALGFAVVPSAANYVFVKPPERPAKAFYEELASRKVLVRHFERPHVDEYLRITVGSPEQNAAFLKAIRQTMLALGLTVPDTVNP